jgi:hypothetical protein
VTFVGGMPVSSVEVFDIKYKPGRGVETCDRILGLMPILKVLFHDLAVVHV